METAFIALLSSLLGVIVSGIISYFLQKQRFEHESNMKFEDNKTENMAVKTANHYLMVNKYCERSFDHLKTKIGGFDDDELRKILVRAGAVRNIRKDTGEEFWCLTSRLREKYGDDNIIK